MMQMLHAGGLPALTDGARAPDADNPRGYYEWERIKSLPRDPQCIAEAEGKAVKVISTLLMSLPQGFDYRVIFMCRPIAEVAASQAAMIARLQASGSALSAEAMMQALASHLKQIKAWIAARSWLRVRYLDYPAVLRDAATSASEIETLLGTNLATEAMVCAVDPLLRRQRT